MNGKDLTGDTFEAGVELGSRETSFDRRQALLAGAVAASSVLMAGTAQAESGHEHHMDHGSGDHASHGAAHQKLIDTALACVNRGDVCLNHCIGLLGQGDTSLKECLRTVSAMLPTCTGLARLAALDATRLKAYAAVCIEICDDCEKECRKHQDHHAACKACAESCAKCIAECKKVVDA